MTELSNHQRAGLTMRPYRIAAGSASNNKWKSTPRVSVAFPPEMLAEIARRAKASNRSFAAVVRSLLETALRP